MSQATVRIRRDGKSPEPFRFPFKKRELERLKPTDKRRWVYDEGAAGLALQITPTGKRTFYYCKRIEGRYRKVRLGDFGPGGITIEQARNLAARQAGKIAEGENPAEAKRQARAAMTFGELFDTYLERHAKVHKRTWAEDQRQYEKYLKQWSGRRLDQIKRQDVASLHARIGKTAPISANRVLALLSSMFSVGERFGYTGDNPCTKVKRFSEQQRERFLDADEMARFLEAVEQDVSPLARDFIKALLFTAQRRGNVEQMTWSELDLRRRVWTIPGAKFKTGGDVEVPLVPQVIEILERRKAEAGEGAEYVFPSSRADAKVPHFRDCIPALKRVTDAGGIKGLRPHDLRRTAASWATMEGVAYPIVAKMLGHKIQGVTGIYARFDMDSMRVGFERTVNAMLATAGAEKPSNGQQEKAGKASGRKRKGSRKAKAAKGGE